MSPRKGAELLRAASGGLRRIAQVTFVGCGEDGVALAKACGWQSIERYLPDELPDILRGITPHAGLLASIVPESFSYTLSELLLLGIPPLATDLGSFRDRIVDGENGFLFEPNPHALVALARRLHAQPELLAGVARNLAAAPRARTTAEMVGDYHSLLPLEARPVARFRVGVGRQTGLTEPYRQLDEAYAQLSEAYKQKDAAYERERALRATYEAFVQELRALEVLTHPWRAPKAVELVYAFNKKLQSVAAGRVPEADIPAR